MGPDEFAALYREEAEAVLMFHTRRTFDAEVALELTAETFAEAWRSRRGLRATGGVELRAWLFTIARRRWTTFLERGRVERKTLARLRVTMPVFHEDDLEEIHERAGLPQLRHEVAMQLAELSAQHREAVQLRVVEERDYPDVAALLGVSEQTARARVSRGLRALGRALDTGPDLSVEAGERR
jgi:RNA polymerase sigma-70 factor (ECF subfamily)